MDKIALVHEWLTTFAGSESVLSELYKLYPTKIFTLFKDDKAVRESELKDASIEVSFLQKFPKIKTQYRNYLLFFPMAIEQFNLNEYDVIISSSHAVAKGVLTNHHQIHVSYCHSPVRYAWDLYHQYLESSNLNHGPKGFIAKIILHYLRLWDIASTNRVDYFIANSNYIKKRIKKIYNRDAKVIYPPVNVDEFTLETNKQDYYLTASRLVPYKKIDLIIRAFGKMPDKKLVVIGDGPEMKKIKNNCPQNIELLGYLDKKDLIYYMQHAKAFIFAAEEDFGIIPVEAQACGTPVIAYNRGGARETVIEGTTGVFFDEQNENSLIEAVKKFDKLSDDFDPIVIRKNSERFSQDVFRNEIKKYVDELREKHEKKSI